MSSPKVFTSRILVVPDTFGYNEISSDIVFRLNISKPLFVYINDDKSIKIEQLRDLQIELASPPVDPQQTRIVIIHPLEKILHVAQQSLLKLLEEPPERTAIFLVGNSLGNLADTILSRCEVIRVAVVADDGREQGRDLWQEIETRAPISVEDLVGLLSSAPEKKEEAVIWIRGLLQRPPKPTKESVVLLEALNQAYEALLSNVTPKLVWAKIVAHYRLSV